MDPQRKTTHSVLNYRLFDFFDTKFDHSFYPKPCSAGWFSQPAQCFSLTQNQSSHQPASHPAVFFSHAKSAQLPATSQPNEAVCSYVKFGSPLAKLGYTLKTGIKCWN